MLSPSFSFYFLRQNMLFCAGNFDFRQKPQGAQLATAISDYKVEQKSCSVSPIPSCNEHDRWGQPLACVHIHRLRKVTAVKSTKPSYCDPKILLSRLHHCVLWIPTSLKPIHPNGWHTDPLRQLHQYFTSTNAVWDEEVPNQNLFLFCPSSTYGNRAKANCV